MEKPSNVVGIEELVAATRRSKKGHLTQEARRAANKLAAARATVLELARTSGTPAALQVLRVVEAQQLAAAAAAQAVTSSTEGESTEGQQGGRVGRPSEVSPEAQDSICAWIAAGGSLRAWCREHGRAMETVYRWLRQDAPFHTRFAQAHEDRADTLTDEMLAIADDSAGPGCSIEGVAAAKLRVEARKWIAQKLKPQKWGDRSVIEHQGAVSIRIGIPQVAREVASQQTPLVQRIDS